MVLRMKTSGFDVSRPEAGMGVWMQNTGAILLAAQRCSLVRMWTPAQDSRSAHGLLYSLLYGPISASKNTVKGRLTLILRL